MVIKKISLIGNSEDSWEDAAENAIGRAMKTIEDIEWVEVVGNTAHVGDGGIDLYRTEVEVAFHVRKGVG